MAEPKSLKSVEEAFKYPIPIVRRIEQQLRRDAAASEEKLRSLVGSISCNAPSLPSFDLKTATLS